MLNIRMTEEEFFDEIYTLLGDSMVNVELSERDLRVAFNRAKRTYIQHGANNYDHGYYCLNVKKSCQEYKLPSDIHTVVKIIKPGSPWNVDDPWAVAAYNQVYFNQPTSIGTSDFLTIEFMQQNLEIWSRYTVQDIDFQYNNRMGVIRFLQKPRGDQRWLIECYKNLTDDEYRGVLWIQSWTLAEAKGILGTAYRKFSGLPGPDGSSMSLGGDMLIQESTEEKRILMEDIQNGVSGDTEWWGVTVG